jgi:acetyltransferase
MDDYRNVASLKPFFEPASVAVIGASRTPGKGGYNIVENLLRLGYRGKIYPVNPRGGEVLGLKMYPSLRDVPATPELALIIVPPARVPGAFKDCLAAGVKAVIIESAGFGETDAGGARAQAEIARLAAGAGVRVMGPNSVGTINPAAGFDSSLGRLNETFLPDAEIKNGSVAFVGQTGLFTGVYLPLINEEIGVSKIACLGNKCDVDESDMLEYLGADPETKAIAMYLESIKDGRRFLRLSRRIIREKPIVVLKAAVTESGARASVSHTGSIAGEDRVYDAAFRQAGITRVGSFGQLWDVCRAFAHLPLPRGNRVGMVNLSGSGCVTAVDACARHGLEIAGLAPATVAKIKPLYPDWWEVRSPVDVWTAVEVSGFARTYSEVTRALLADEGVDAVIVISGAVNWMPGHDVPAMFGGIREEFPAKPVLAVTPLGDRDVFLRMHRGFLSRGIPSYAGDEEAIASLAALCRYKKFLNGAAPS